MESRDALKPLTSLRFAAALLVFSWHCVPTRQISATFSLGYAGVSFFFLLSGFILTYGYHRAFAGGIELGALRTFYAARIARVYPLHLVTLLLMVLCLPYLGENSVWTGVDAQTRLGEIAAGAVLIQSWFPDRVIHFGGNGPAWRRKARPWSGSRRTWRTGQSAAGRTSPRSARWPRGCSGTGSRIRT